MNSIRKWLYRPRRDDTSLLAQFYFADEGLNLVAGELDSFDGRKDPERCSALVNQLRQCQDKVLNICIEMMDDLLPDERASRDFRIKFPDDVMQENLFGQLWFGAECLAAGNSILNRESESTRMRPLAKAVTKTIENVRNLLREQCLKPNPDNIEHIRESLKIFDHFFAEFELSYVSAMVPVKSIEEHDMQENVVVMFSETLQRALKIGLVGQDQVDNYDPALMFTIPRLAIVCGLIIFPDGPLCLEKESKNVSELFRPFKTLLHKIRELLWTMTTQELATLEKCLCSMEEPDISLKNLSDEQSMPPDAYGALAYTSEFVQRFYTSYPSCRQLTPDLTSLCPSGKRLEKLDRKRERASGKGSKTRARQERQNERFLSRLTGGEERLRARRRSRRGSSNLHREQLPDSWSGNYYAYPPVEVNSSERHRNSRYVRQYNHGRSYIPVNNHVYFRTPSGVSERLPHYPYRQQSQYRPSYAPDRINSILCDCGSNRQEGNLVHAIRGSTPPEHDHTYAMHMNPCSFYPNYCIDSSEQEHFENPRDGFNGYRQQECAFMSFENGSVELEPNKTPANIQECVSNVVSADPSLLSPAIFYDDMPENNPHRLEIESLTSEISHLNIDLHLSAMPPCPSCNVQTCCCNKAEPVTSDSPSLCPSESKATPTDNTKGDCDKVCDKSSCTPESCKDCKSTPVPSARSIHTSLRPYGYSQEREQCLSCPENQPKACCEAVHDQPNYSCTQKDIDELVDIDGGSSGSTSPHHSGTEDDEEVALALQAAEVAATWKARAKFSDPRDLIHRLFVCIAGVADQLQTNHASDLRKILKSVFLVNQTPDPEEEQKFVEEIGNEELSPNTESEQFSVESAEDALVVIGTPEAQRVSSPDEVADLEDEEEPCADRMYQQNLLGDDGSSASDNSCTAANFEMADECSKDEPMNATHEASNKDNSPTREAPDPETPSSNDTSSSLSETSSTSLNHISSQDVSPSANGFLPSASTLIPVASESRGDPQPPVQDASPLKNLDKEVIAQDSEVPFHQDDSPLSGVLQDSAHPRTAYIQDPPPWVPDILAPRCMACKASFTMVRRRHHCRNCGKVFCSHCSRHYVPLPHFGIWKNVRVCNACFLYYVTTSADGSAALS